MPAASSVARSSATAQQQIGSHQRVVIWSRVLDGMCAERAQQGKEARWIADSGQRVHGGAMQDLQRLLAATGQLAQWQRRKFHAQ
jgi:hypothetical protein